MNWRPFRRAAAPVDDPVIDGFESRRLEAVARSLSPQPEVLERVRASVLGEFSAAANRAGDARRGSTGRGRSWMPVPRLASAVLIGVVLAVGSVGLVAGSTPGRPFYGLRLALESLTLPAAGTPARVQAQLERLDRRLSEADKATLQGDPGAASDALAAYRAELQDAGTDVDGSEAGRLSQALDQHAILLARLGSELTGTAKTATADALEQVTKVQERLRSKPSHPANGNDSGGGNPGNGGGNPAGGGSNPGSGGSNPGGGTNPGGGNPGNGGGNPGNGGGNPGNGNGPGATPSH